MRNLKPHISFTDLSVIKQGSIDATNIEVAKARAAVDLAGSCGLFQTPRVLACDIKAGIYEQERIYGFKNLQLMAAYGLASNPIWYKIGRALAVIHKQLNPINCPKINLPSEWQGSDIVWIHGDFNLINVSYIQNTNTPLIFDWSTPSIIRGVYSRGPSLFDVAWFLKSLFFLPSKMIFPHSIEKKANNFLNGYTSHTLEVINNKELIHLTLESTALFKKNFSKTRMKHYIYSNREKRLIRFLENRENT